MSALTEFVLVSHWKIDAPRDRVWEVIRTPTQWPRWWRYVAAVEEIDAGNGDGIGARHRVHWTSRLPYSIDLLTRVAEVRPRELIRVEANGDLRGEGVWRLSERADATDVDYTWRVGLDKSWMRALAPLMRPVFTWNHNAVMAAGESGLNKFLR